jgi:hypothetical protein
MARTILSLLCFGLIATVLVTKRTTRDAHEDIDKSLGSAHSLTRLASSRKVYPYSVVPGGVESASEVRAAMARDATVAAHYASIKVTALRPSRQVGDIRRYVSYRMNGKIYWTSKPVTIRNGELLLTDGLTTLRGRCGNRLADARQSPTQAATDEPLPEESEDPIPLAYMPQNQFVDVPGSFVPAESGSPQEIVSVFDGTPPANGLPAMSALPTSKTGAPTGGGGGGGPYIPGGFTPALLHYPKTNSDGNSTNTVDVLATPEPATIGTIGLGLACLLLSRRTRRPSRS